MADTNMTNQDYNIDFERIKELISLYEQIKNSGEIKQYNEESTKQNLILPLFEALGWNVYNRVGRNDSVNPEEKNKANRRVDYGFRINGIPKFFLEAKSIRETNIEYNDKYVNQAIDYAYWKSCSWAILTNFETIAIYNADLKGLPFGYNHLFTFHPSDFLTNPKFKLLSKKAFENDEIDKIALEYGKKQFKNPIDKQLLLDMIHFREILSKDIIKNNQDKNLTQEKIDESVQRILARLIFIRNAEDRGYEENKLLSISRQWNEKSKGELVKEIWDIYKYYDKVYNSKLFGDTEPHLADKLIISDEALQEVIEGLNESKDKSYSYDFSIIEADVLGKMYEQYLGNILKATPKRAKLEESEIYRKEQGVYYTPPYIVDYIVKNTVGKYIKTHTPEEIKKVRILDPACGSGSFLIRAYKELENYWTKELKEGDLRQTKWDIENSELFYSIKTEILKNNIFGVDLDPKAVEIAQLNLLLQISEKGEKLPLLQNNIKVRNSLIDDPSITDKAFKWEEEFPEIMKEGGFDIIIGNPPYGAQFNSSEKALLRIRFENEKSGNSASYFIFNSFKLLNKNGYFGMILPKQLTYINSWTSTRKLLTENSISIIIDASEAFGDVELEQVIVIARASNATLNNKVEVGFVDNTTFHTWKTNNQWFSEDRFPIWITEENFTIFKKITENSEPLSNVANINWGGNVAKYLTQQDNSNSIPCIRGRDIQRYHFDINWYIPIDKIIDSYYVRGEKLILQRIVSRFGKKLTANYRNARIIGCYSNDNFYADKTVTLIWNSKIELKFLIGLLNSKLISWFAHRYIYNRSQLTMEFMYDYARNFPILRNIPAIVIKQISERVDKIQYNINLMKSDKNKDTDAKMFLYKQTERLSDEIDKIIYNLYGLNEKEIRIVEEDYSYWPLV